MNACCADWWWGGSRSGRPARRGLKQTLPNKGIRTIDDAVPVPGKTRLVMKMWILAGAGDQSAFGKLSHYRSGLECASYIMAMRMLSGNRST